MTAGTVAAGFVRGLLDFAASKGASAAVLAASAGIDVHALDDRDARVPLARYIALLRAAKEACRDPALALHYGEALDIAELSIVGAMSGMTSTIAGGIAQLNRYSRLIVDFGGAAADRFVVEHRGDEVWLVDTRRNPNDAPELTESAFARMAAMTRRHLGAPFAVAMHFTHPAPAYRAEYERIFRAPLFFDSDRNAIVLRAEWLMQQTKATPGARHLAQVVSAHADELLERLERTKSVRGRVESELLPMLRGRGANMIAVARKLGMTRQTLFRKLKAEGVTFEQVLDELRRTLALHYLGEQRASVGETAYLVGFSDPAAFSRAFKRWTGKSPSDVVSKDTTSGSPPRAE